MHSNFKSKLVSHIIILYGVEASALGVSIIATINCSSFVYRSHDFFVVIMYQSERT